MKTTQPSKDKAKVSSARRDGLLLLLLGSVVFVLLGVVLERSAPSQSVDFRVMYYPARCLLQHQDPYDPTQVLSLYRAEGGDAPTDTNKIRLMVSGYVYPPNAFTFTLPFAMLTWGPAHIFWQVLIVASYLLAAYMVWDLTAQFAPLAGGALICLLLVNSELLLVTSNAAGIVLSLCAIAVCCFLRERFVLAGIVCLAVAMLLKPQDAGLVWLYFLLAGGVQRKCALQTLLLTAALSVPSVLWVSHAVPNWTAEWHANLATAAARGGTSDPGPASQAGHGLAGVISLQSAISVFRDDPRFYNLVSYVVCAPLLLAWAMITLRSRFTPARAWLALASVSALTMLPVYHRQYDAKLLLLTVPACLMLRAESGMFRWLAPLVTIAAFVLTGDLTWAILLGLIRHLHLPATPFGAQMSMALQVFPSPLILLVTGVFYLWAYARKSPRAVSEIEARI
jgi:Glycosyltransferase family 87